MKRFAYMSLRILGVVMFVGGILLFLLFRYNEWEARIEHLYSEMSMWQTLSYISIGVFLNSLPVFGFSFIVEAACKYIDKCNEEEAEE